MSGNGGWSGFFVMDPADLESIYSNEDGIGSVDFSFVENLREDRAGDFEKVKEALTKLPPREADFLELYFFNRVRQAAIAEVFGISQPSVCYRLKRAAARIKYLLTMPEFDMDKAEEDLKSVLSDPIDVRIMLEMINTTCQSDVARSIGATQGYVRHRFFRTLKALESMHGMDEYVALFRHVADHLNILKENQQSAWSDPVVFVVS
jgi:hypothetical protein